MANYILTGTVNPTRCSTPESSKSIAANFATFLESKAVLNYEVRTGYHSLTGTWRLAVMLQNLDLGSAAEAEAESNSKNPTPKMTMVKDVEYLFRFYVDSDSACRRWIDKITDCEDLVPGWVEWDGQLEHQTRICWDKSLGETC